MVCNVARVAVRRRDLGPTENYLFTAERYGYLFHTNLIRISVVLF